MPEFGNGNGNGNVQKMKDQLYRFRMSIKMELIVRKDLVFRLVLK